jgi:hypothetical protein
MRRTSTNLSQMALIGFEAGNFLLFACASVFHVLRTFSVRIVIAVGEEGKGRKGKGVMFQHLGFATRRVLSR